MITRQEARPLYGDADAAHGFAHVLRVLRLAERIAAEEGADLEIVRTAALLHDMARADEARTGRCHAEAGAERARKVLRGHDPERVERVVEAIAAHRFRGGSAPQSLEARVLYDADKLDAIGAVGVARAYAICGLLCQPLWGEPDEALGSRAPQEARDAWGAAGYTPVHEFHFKLCRLRDSLFTPTARRLAEGRHAFMKAFFQQMEREMRAEA
ncbi:MAG: HD domain-containing protein [Anaerolineae bacterium]